MTFGEMVPRRWRREAEALPLSSLHRQMNSLFGDFLSDWPAELLKGVGTEHGAFTPKITVTEDEKQLTVTCELPGIDEKDVDLTLGKDSVTIRGHKKVEHERKEGGTYYSERAQGEFERVIRFASKIEEDKVDATYKNGVLTLILPKTVESQRENRKISIKRA